MILKGWKQPEGAVHLVTPPGGPRPARVEVLADFLAKQLASSRKRTSSALPLRGARRKGTPIAHPADFGYAMTTNQNKITGEKPP